MRGLLIVLCALVTSAAVLAGGCAFLFTGAVAPDRNNAMQVLMVTGPLILVTVAVTIINVALIVALAGSRAPRRNAWFLLLAVVDLVVAVALVAAGVAGRGPVNIGDVSTLLLPAVLAIKGVLTLLLPAQPPRLPPRLDGHQSRTGS
jgi:cytochrome bd-type quinol oxidase subunit 2